MAGEQADAFPLSALSSIKTEEPLRISSTPEGGANSGGVFFDSKMLGELEGTRFNDEFSLMKKSETDFNTLNIKQEQSCLGDNKESCFTLTSTDSSLSLIKCEISADETVKSDGQNGINTLLQQAKWLMFLNLRCFISIEGYDMYRDLYKRCGPDGSLSFHFGVRSKVETDEEKTVMEADISDQSALTIAVSSGCMGSDVRKDPSSGRWAIKGQTESRKCSKKKASSATNLNLEGDKERGMKTTKDCKNSKCTKDKAKKIRERIRCKVDDDETEDKMDTSPASTSSYPTHKTEETDGTERETALIAQSGSVVKNVEEDPKTKVAASSLDQSRTFYCEHCTCKFQTKTWLARHVKTNHGKKHEPVCETCHKLFSSKCSLKKHVWAVHSTGSHPRPFACDHDQCTSTFRTNSELKLHLRMVHVDKSFQCEICKNRYKTKYRLKDHMKIHDPHREKPAKSKTANGYKFPCSTCSKRYTTSSHLRAHQRVHTQTKDYVCEVCGVGFYYRGHLTAHMYTHTGQRPYICDVCHTTFNKSSHLATHRRKHHSPTPLECQICDSQFSSVADYQSHDRLHNTSGHVCDVCDAWFDQKVNLKAHRRIHTGHKPYVCHTCGHATSHQSALVLHMRRHTGESPYVCFVCGQKFKGCSYRNAHVKREHPGQLPWPCPKCALQFQYKREMKSHLYRDHVFQTQTTTLHSSPEPHTDGKHVCR